MNLFQDLFQKIGVTLTSIFVVITTTFTGQKTISTPTPAPAPPVVEYQIESSPPLAPYKNITPIVKATSKPVVLDKIPQKLEQKEQPTLFNPPKEQTQNSSSQDIPTIIYSEADCEKQIKDILPKVESSYADWWNQFQATKRTMDSCYSQETTLVCDNKLSKLNVEWQNKITEIINNYKKGLSSCNPNDVRFSKFSNIISSSY